MLLERLITILREPWKNAPGQFRFFCVFCVQWNKLNVNLIFVFLQHFRGRKNRCYSLAVRAVRRAFIYASKARKAKRRNMRQVENTHLSFRRMRITPVNHSWPVTSVPQLWISRIAAATREHHMKYPALVHNLLKVSAHACLRFITVHVRWLLNTCVCPSQSSVQLNRRVLCDLSITEPRSFLALAKLARARQQEGFRAALGDGNEPPGVFSRITQLSWSMNPLCSCK